MKMPKNSVNTLESPLASVLLRTDASPPSGGASVPLAVALATVTISLTAAGSIPAACSAAALSVIPPWNCAWMLGHCESTPVNVTQIVATTIAPSRTSTAMAAACAGTPRATIFSTSGYEIIPITTARMSGTEMLELAPMNAATMTSTPTALMNAMLPIATLITQPGMIPGPALTNWLPALRIRSLSRAMPWFLSRPFSMSPMWRYRHPEGSGLSPA